MTRNLPDVRLRLALPFAVLPQPGVVRLAAGEDFRYTLRAPGIESWLPALLSRLDGRTRLAEALAGVGDGDREAARAIAERLFGERVLVESTAAEAHRAMRAALLVEGGGPIAERLRALPQEEGPALAVFCQDRLDYAAALDFNRRALEERFPWIWATTGPLQRGYAGPVFLPDAGPCLACLLAHFRRLSPAPEFYDSPAGPEAPFPAPGAEILARLVAWKAALLSEEAPPAALYRLHALEVATLEVTAHAVLLDPECPACGERG